MNFNQFLNFTLIALVVTVISFTLLVLNSKDKVKKFYKIIGFFAHLAAIHLISFALILRWRESGHIPLSNTYETMIVFSWFLLSASIFFIRLDKERLIILFSSLLSLMFLAAATGLVSDSARPLVPALQSNWLTIHVFFTFIGYCGFALSFLTSIIYMFSKIDKRAMYDTFTYKSILFALPFLTLGIVTGSIWANRAWGSYWSWDPKETWALITWFYYAVFLHLRMQSKWSGKRMAILSIVGFIFVMFTYFGVNYLLAGLHSYG